MLRCEISRETICSSRILDFLNPWILHCFRQIAPDEQVVPELSRYHRRQTQLHGKARQGTDRHPPNSPPPMMDRRNVKISCAPQRFFTQKLRDERRLRFNEETIQGSAENRLASAVNGTGHPAFGQETQQVFVPKPA